MPWRTPPNDPPVDYLDFPDFYTNPFIESIADNRRWSISDKDKKPIDMHRLVYYNDPTMGAKFTDETSMRTLHELCEILPNASNNAYHLESTIDGACVLDIEKTCPAKLRDKLMRLPYIYAERSLSGKGYHLVLPINLFENLFEKYPNASKKAVIKKKNKDFELLFEHWVTFTRDTKNIPPATGTITVEELFEDLFKEQITISTMDFALTTVNKDAQYNVYLEELYNQVIANYHKTPEDFDNDMSRFEYSKVTFIEDTLYLIIARTVAYQAQLNQRLENQGRAQDCKQLPTSDPSERSMLVYEVAKATIPYRDKHDQIRNGVPWLMYYAQKAVGSNRRLTEQSKSLYEPRKETTS